MHAVVDSFYLVCCTIPSVESIAYCPGERCRTWLNVCLCLARCGKKHEDKFDSYFETKPTFIRRPCNREGFVVCDLHCERGVFIALPSYSRRR